MKDIPIAFIDDETLYESENFVDFKLKGKDKEIERLNKELEVYKEFEQWLNNQEEYYSTFSKEIVKTIHWINITLKHKKALKGSDKE